MEALSRLFLVGLTLIYPYSLKFLYAVMTELVKSPRLNLTVTETKLILPKPSKIDVTTSPSP